MQEVSLDPETKEINENLLNTVKKIKEDKPLLDKITKKIKEHNNNNCSLFNLSNILISFNGIEISGIQLFVEQITENGLTLNIETISLFVNKNETFYDIIEKSYMSDMNISILNSKQGYNKIFKVKLLHAERIFSASENVPRERFAFIKIWGENEKHKYLY